MDAETTVVVVAGGLGVIALLIVIGYCGNQNKFMRLRTPSNLVERMADVRNGQHRGQQRLVQVEERGSYYRSRSRNSARVGHPSNPNGNPPREDSPLLGALGTFEENGSPGDWDYTGPDSDNPELLDDHRSRGSGYGGSPTGSVAESRRTTTTSVALTGTSAADEALLSTFIEVLSEGLALRIHRASGKPRKVTLWLKDRDTLVWCSRRSLGTKRWHRLGLRGATHVETGLKSAEYESGSAARASEAVCLSVVFPVMSLDLEASSELEREALVQGFTMLIDDLRREDDRP